MIFFQAIQMSTNHKAAWWVVGTTIVSRTFGAEDISEGLHYSEQS